MDMKCVTGMNPYGHCGSAACCPEPYRCCAACHEDCNIRCGYTEKRADCHAPSGLAMTEEATS